MITTIRQIVRVAKALHFGTSILVSSRISRSQDAYHHMQTLDTDMHLPHSERNERQTGRLNSKPLLAQFCVNVADMGDRVLEHRVGRQHRLPSPSYTVSWPTSRERIEQMLDLKSGP